MQLPTGYTQLIVCFFLNQDFQQVNITSGIVVHRLHLTTKYIRFIRSNWKKGSCVNFDIYGNIACKYFLNNY